MNFDRILKRNLDYTRLLSNFSSIARRKTGQKPFASSHQAESNGFCPVFQLAKLRKVRPFYIFRVYRIIRSGGVEERDRSVA